MEILSTLYTEAIWRPLFSAIVFLYSTIPGGDFGVTVIVFTVLFRIVSFPLHWKARRAQQALAFIQPEMKKIQEKHKNDREAQGRALMELYAQKNREKRKSGETRRCQATQVLGKSEECAVFCSYKVIFFAPSDRSL